MGLEQLSDKALIFSVKDNGNKGEVVEILYRRWRGWVKYFIYQMIRDSNDADDLTQDVFVSVYKGMDRFDNKCRSMTWISAIARNASLNYLEKRRRTREYIDEMSIKETEAGSLVSVLDSPDTELIKKEEKEILNREIGKLSPKYRVPIIYRFIDRKPIMEVCGILGVSRPTAISRLKKGRELLRNRMAKYEFFQ